jgi:hypothetical protein
MTTHTQTLFILACAWCLVTNVGSSLGQIKVEDIKKSERVAMKKLKDGPAHAFATPEKKKPVVDEAKRRQMQEQLMKNTQKLVPEGAAVVHRDFFGRVIASPQKEPARSPVKSPRKGTPAHHRTTAHNTRTDLPTLLVFQAKRQPRPRWRKRRHRRLPRSSTSSTRASPTPCGGQSTPRTSCNTHRHSLLSAAHKVIRINVGRGVTKPLIDCTKLVTARKGWVPLVIRKTTWTAVRRAVVGRRAGWWR